MDDNGMEEIYSHQFWYHREDGPPASMIAEQDQVLAKTLDLIRGAHQFVVIVGEKATLEGQGVEAFFSTNGNTIEIVNFLHLMHQVFHDRLGALLKMLPGEAIEYFLRLERGEKMLSPVPDGYDE